MASLKTTHRWVLAPENPRLADDLAVGLGVPSLVARIMVAHGIGSVEEGRAFLTPSLDRDWADPLDIPGMPAVVERVARAVRDGERIAVFGDFDVDGITSTCLLTEALRELGASVHPFIPHRFEEGYGLSQTALDRVMEVCDPALVVTVDNGIAARNEVAFLSERGVDLVVTDHHEPADMVPEGIPLTDPKLVANGPSHELAGAGVALKLVQALGSRLGAPDLWRRYIEVAALGTVSDMMLLTPENRALVAEGIAQMRSTERPGFIALAAVTRTDLSTITADALSFSLIPRLNAAGRMADPALALNLLLERDPVEAGRLASELEAINQERRDIEAALADEAVARVEETYTGGRVIVVGGEGWHEGVKGIVASRLVNRYHVPVLLFHGTADDIVPCESGLPFQVGLDSKLYDRLSESWQLYGSAALYRHMRSLNMPVEYVPFPGYGHEPQLSADGSVNANMDTILARTDRFLYAHVSGHFAPCAIGQVPGGVTYRLEGECRPVAWMADGGLVVDVADGKRSATVAWFAGAERRRVRVVVESPGGVYFEKVAACG